MIKQFKAKAYNAFAQLLSSLVPSDTPKETLDQVFLEHDFVGMFSEKEFADKNLDFDLTSCFARTVLAVLVLEKYFPQSRIVLVEVVGDSMRNILMHIAKNNPEKWEDESFVAEVLHYESPHLAIEIDKAQYDPILSKYGLPNHEQVNHLPDVWNTLYATYLVSAGSEKYYRGDLVAYQNYLLMAKEASRGLLLVYKNLFFLSLETGDLVLRKSSMDQLDGKWKSASFLFSAYLASGDKKFLSQFDRVYSKQVQYYLEKKVALEITYVTLKELKHARETGYDGFRDYLKKKIHDISLPIQFLDAFLHMKDSEIVQYFDREEFFCRLLFRGTYASIVSQNLSHGIGKHILLHNNFFLKIPRN